MNMGWNVDEAGAMRLLSVAVLLFIASPTLNGFPDRGITLTTCIHSDAQPIDSYQSRRV